MTMISRVDALTEPDVAVICGLPTKWPVAKPELSMPAKVWSDELQETVLVTSWVLLSLNVAVAVSCCVDPAAMDGLAGVIAMEVNVGAGTPLQPETVQAASPMRNQVKTEPFLGSITTPSWALGDRPRNRNGRGRVETGQATRCGIGGLTGLVALVEPLWISPSGLDETFWAGKRLSA